MQDIAEKPSKWRQPPQDHFFLAGKDEGLSWLKRPGWIMRRVRGARVRQYACSDFPEVQAILERNLEPRWHQDPAIFEINTVPALAENLTFRGAGPRSAANAC